MKHALSRLYFFALAVAALTVISPVVGHAQECRAPELVCKAAANQDRSLYFRDHCRYQQQIHIERFKQKGGGDEDWLFLQSLRSRAPA